MEVGIEECLHIGEEVVLLVAVGLKRNPPKEFEYNKSKYHLRDVVIGKIYFILVRIKIKVSARRSVTLLL